MTLMKSLRIVALVLLLATTTACARSAAGPKPGARKACPYDGPTSVGEALPDCTLPGIDGGPALRLADLKGKPAVLNFWASWCGACIREMPAFQRVHADLGQQVEFVGLDEVGVEGETETQGIRFAKQTGITYRLAQDPGGGLFAHFLARTVLPITVFVGADGRVADRHFGELTEQDLRSTIRDSLHVP